MTTEFIAQVARFGEEEVRCLQEVAAYSIQVNLQSRRYPTCVAGNSLPTSFVALAIRQVDGMTTKNWYPTTSPHQRRTCFSMSRQRWAVMLLLAEKQPMIVLP